MLRKSWLNTVVVPLVAFVAVLTLASQVAEAQVKPFKITGSGVAPSGLSLIPGVPAPHVSTGQATELGNHTGAGFFTILDFTGPLTAEFSSAPTYVFTAANGDKLAFTYGDVNNGAASPGEVTLIPNSDGSFSALFVAEFNPVPSQSTGRFAKVTGGSFVMIAQSSPFFLFGTASTPFSYTWEGEGTLTFQKGK
jgi:hypothetical protein